jgi:uncharacterized Ntn-hydrolase superfamily protein
VAVASKFPAVGALVPWAQAASGAVATPSFANTSFGPRGLALMAAGQSAPQALKTLLADDLEREQRQVGLVDLKGGSATFTGSACFAWAGGVSGPGYAIQGNILKSSRVVPAMEKAFIKAQGALPARLYQALFAGDRAGGDRRGRQSAAIFVAKPGAGYGGFNDRWLDYRVDGDADPVARLGELLEIHALFFEKSPEADRVQLKGKRLERLQLILYTLGYLRVAPSGRYDEPTREAFQAFIGNENFEERADPYAGWVDRPVLNHIYRKFQK